MPGRPTVTALLAREIPGFVDARTGLSFVQLGVDSFRMLELRVAVEQAFGGPIADEVWMRIETPSQLCACLGEGPDKTAEHAAGARLHRQYEINMPQMALGGLSESWLLKELGDAHWAMITNGLGAASSTLCDGNGERLYATFVRLRIEATTALARFEENEQLALDAQISRFGAGMFFSELALANQDKSIRASIMSSFTRRGSPTSNESLQKGQPAIPPGCSIPEVAAMPEFGQGYRQRRNAAPPPSLFETTYDIIPYHDINGVGLLYFATYPLISDICELRYVGRANAWALESSTVSRDVCYFANCNAHDRLTYRVHARRDTADGVEIESSLARLSDGALMAYLVTRKAVVRG